MQLNALKAAGRRFLRDESGQDLIEYALLITFVGLVGAAGIALLGDAMGTTYQSWDSSVQDVWEPCAPGETAPC